MTHADIDREIARRRGLDPQWWQGDVPRIYERGVVRYYSPTTRWEDAGPLLEEMAPWANDATTPPTGWKCSGRDGACPVEEDLQEPIYDNPTLAISRAWLAWDDERRKA